MFIYFIRERVKRTIFFTGETNAVANIDYVRQWLVRLKVMI